MLLTDTATVVNALGIVADATTKSSVSQALAAATSYLSNRIGTEFQRTTRQSVFSVRKTDVAGSSGFVVLRLGCSFLVPGSEVKVRIATGWEGMVNASTELYEGVKMVDYSKGIVQIPKKAVVNPKSLNVSVEYTCGFAVDATDQTMYTGVPEDLRNAAVAYAIKTYYSSQKTPTGSKHLRVDFHVLDQNVMDCHSKYRRPRGDSIWPDADTEIGTP